MKKYKILGYSNPITCNCVPVITIIEVNNEVHALFPDCTIKKLNIKTESEFMKLENHIPEMEDKYIVNNEFSYINFDGKIKTNTIQKLLQEMRLDIDKLDKGSIHKSMLEDLISFESIKLDAYLFKVIKDQAKMVLSDVFKRKIQIPIDLNTICSENNIFLSENNIMTEEGRILKILKKNIKIEYKLINNAERERFTIAHELGHYFLHFENDVFYNDSGNNFNDESFIQYAARLEGDARKSEKEKEASLFAAELLMPDEEVINFICNKNWKKHIYLTDLTLEMSKYFNVSRNSLILKLRRLEFLEKKDPLQIAETSNLIINQNTLKKFLNRYVPKFSVGDTVRVAIEIKECEKERVESFEGTCIALRGQGTGLTMIIRKIGANAVVIEKIFYFYSEDIKSITVIKRGRIHRESSGKGKGVKVKGSGDAK